MTNLLCCSLKCLCLTNEFNSLVFIMVLGFTYKLQGFNWGVFSFSFAWYLRYLMSQQEIII